MRPSLSNLSYGLAHGDPSVLIFLILFTFLGEFGAPFPLVLESVLIFVGYRLSHGEIWFLSALFYSGAGSVLGALSVFFLSRFFGQVLLFGLFPFIKKKSGDVFEMSQKVGILGVFGITLARLTPGLLVPTSIASGIAGVPFAKFLPAVLLSELVWYVIFLTLGAFLGKAALRFTFHLSVLFRILFLVAAVLLLFLFLKRKKKN